MAEAPPLRPGPAVILDANFLFVPLQFRVDIVEELRRLLGGNVRCVVPSPVISELEALRRGAGPSLGRRVEFALTFAERCERAETAVGAGETIDDLLIRLGKLWRCPVATNDAELRRRLRSEGVPVIYLRRRAYLEMEGTIQIYDTP